MRENYKQYFILNKNLLIAFSASIIISALVAQMLSEQTDLLNTTYTLTVDYVIFFSVFGSLYYFDNRKNYLLQSGKRDTSRIRRDLIKIVTSLGIAEVVYTIMRWFLQYYFLLLDYDAYLASIISQVISTIVYLLVVNLSIKMTRMYDNEN
jgi:polyferredoxin